MTCDDVRTELGPYVLGLLDPSDRDAVRRHLDTCAGCSEEYDELADLPFFLGTVSAEEAQEGPVRAHPALLERMIAQAARERAAQRASRRRRWSLIGAAAAALVVLAAFLVGQLGGDEQESPALEHVSATDPSTHVSAALTLQPKGWGTKMSLVLAGVGGPQKCALVAVGGDGTRQTAATWSVPAGGYNQDRPLLIDGAVGISLAEIDHFEVVTLDGSTLVTVDT